MLSTKKILSLSSLSLLVVVGVSGCTTDGGQSSAQSSQPSGGQTMTESPTPTPTPSASAAPSGETVMPVVTGAAGKAPTITPPSGPAPTELVAKDIYAGNGATVTASSTLTVQYTLMAWSTGKVVETSWTSQAATFPLSGVISGWQKGLPGMKAGGRRLLIIPPADAYGASGSGPIGANETLIFVVDVLAVK